jgi:heat shock protein HslJ
MNKIIIFIVLLSSLYTQAQIEPKPFNAISGIWEGEMPCADCEFISVRLNLKNDNVFEIRYTYTGKDVAPYTEGGSWNFSNDSLTLSAETGVKLNYFLSGNKLALLDAEGKAVPNAMLTKLSRNGEDVTHESFEKNDDRLGGSWQLERLSGKSLSEYGVLEGKDIPQIVIKVSDNGFSGFMGCNRISGGFEAIGNSIKFGNMISTKMMCDNMQLEQEFFNVFNGKQLEFKVEDKKLLFKDLSGMEVAEFKNTD